MTWTIIRIRDTRSVEEIGDRFVPIPGTGDERECDRCRRAHEIHVDIVTEYDEYLTVGLGCARIGHPELESQLKSGASAATTYARLKAEVARREIKAQEWRDAWAVVNAVSFPGYSESPDALFRDGSVRWTVNGARAFCIVSPHADHAERFECLESSWREEMMLERGFHRYNREAQLLEGARTRLSRAERKLRKLSLAS